MAGPGEDEHVYGFNFPDAQALLAGLPYGTGREQRLHTHPRGGGGGIAFYTYVLTTDVVAGTPSTAKADIFSPDDESTSIETEADWIGNLAMFDDQVTGDGGTCVKVGNKYHAVNAPGCGIATGGSSGISIGPTPPEDTSQLWIDTSAL